jgi:hypothetical protein
VACICPLLEQKGDEGNKQVEGKEEEEKPKHPTNLLPTGMFRSLTPVARFGSSRFLLIINLLLSHYPII